jgi:hypothetical protein
MQDTLTKEEIAFTNAFDTQRATLAGFAHCASEQELHLVRDGVYLGLGSHLCPIEYEPVKWNIVMDTKVADTASAASSSTTTATTATSEGVFAHTIASAREADGWNELVDAVKTKATAVGSDIDKIWMTLERGRMEWLTAVSAAHGIKRTLQSALANGAASNTTSTSTSTSEEEELKTDAKMLWMYSLCLNIPELKHVVETWSNVVQLKEKNKPLVGYKAHLWDPRKEEWRPLDFGAQQAAERGGSSIDQAWNA